jgi:glucose/arabinose dehydrogenase
MRRNIVRATITCLTIACAVVGTIPPAFAATAVPVATGLNDPVGFTFAPNGELVYLERHTGWLRFRNLQTDVDRQVYRVGSVNSEGERGALGVDLHPAWPTSPFVYVFATRNTPAGVRNQVLRIRLEGGSAVAVRVILSSPAGPNGRHNGGRIAFGPDGKLYVVIGDDALAANSQDLTSNLRGKILRVNADGSIPADNPFGDQVWAYGVRNSIGFAFDPATGRLWHQDNGPECNDELNRIVRGGNHGWGPLHDCPNTNNSGPTPRILPKHTFVEPVGLTGVAFCRACGLGSAASGDLFVGAVNDGRIRRFDLNSTRTGFASGPVTVLDRPGPVLSIEPGPNGNLFFSDFNGVYRIAP